MSNATASPKAVVDAYVEGTRKRDVALLKEVFHENALMTGWLGPELLTGGPEPFYGALEANEVGADYTATVVSVETAERIATAQLDETNLLGMSFTNHFHMIQMDDGSWRIISKIFRHY